MKRTNPFDKAAVLEDLGPLLQTLYRGFEQCIQRARDFFTEQERTLDRGLAAHLVRYYMKDFLREQVELLDEFEQRNVPNSGLVFRYRGYEIRAWKSGDGSLPPPGDSEVKNEFLRQIRPGYQMTLGDFGLLLQPETPVPNLAILWVVDNSFALQHLIVACPKPDLTGLLPVQTEWVEPVLDPIYTMQIPSAPDVAASSRDLPFERLDSENSEENNNRDIRREDQTSARDARTDAERAG